MHVPLYEAFRTAFLESARLDSALSALDLFINVWVQSSPAKGIPRKILLEKWHLSYTPPIKEPQTRKWSEVPEKRQFLRAILAALQLLPASDLCQVLFSKPNEFSVSYQISSEPVATFNKVGRILPIAQAQDPSLGKISVQLEFLRECSGYSVRLPLKQPRDLLTNSLQIPLVLKVDTMDASYYPQPPNRVSTQPKSPLVASDDLVVKEEALRKEKETAEEAKQRDGPEEKGKEGGNEDPEFFSCISTASDGLASAVEAGMISENVENAYRSCIRSTVPQEETPVIDSPPIVSPPGVREFQQAIHNLQHLQLLQGATTVSHLLYPQPYLTQV